MFASGGPGIAGSLSFTVNFHAPIIGAVKVLWRAVLVFLKYTEREFYLICHRNAGLMAGKFSCEACFGSVL